MKYLPDVRDIIVFGGLGLASYGAWLLAPSAGFILGGLGLFYVGMWGVR